MAWFASKSESLPVGEATLRKPNPGDISRIAERDAQVKACIDSWMHDEDGGTWEQCLIRMVCVLERAKEKLTKELERKSASEWTAVAASTLTPEMNYAAMRASLEKSKAVGDQIAKLAKEVAKQCTTPKVKLAVECPLSSPEVFFPTDPIWGPSPLVGEFGKWSFGVTSGAKIEGVRVEADYKAPDGIMSADATIEGPYEGRPSWWSGEMQRQTRSEVAPEESTEIQPSAVCEVCDQTYNKRGGGQVATPYRMKVACPECFAKAQSPLKVSF